MIIDAAIKDTKADDAIQYAPTKNKIQEQVKLLATGSVVRVLMFMNCYYCSSGGAAEAHQESTKFVAHAQRQISEVEYPQLFQV